MMWERLMLEGRTYIENALNASFNRLCYVIVRQYSGDPAHWPSQSKCLQSTRECVQPLLAEDRLKPVDALAAAVLLNGAAMNAAL